MPRGKPFRTDEERAEGQRERARRWRAKHPEKAHAIVNAGAARRRQRRRSGEDPNAEAILKALREYQARWRREQRAHRTAGALRTAERKRTPAYRAKTNAAKTNPKHHAKQRLVRNRYLAKPESQIKEAARRAVNAAIQRGDLVRPQDCSRCGCTPPRGRDGRSLIRADHYMGYAPEYHLTIQWICTTCDGDLERERRKAPPADPATTEEASTP